MLIRAIITFIYGLTLAAGGVIGYKVARSVPSIISGLFFGVIAISGGALMMGDHHAGFVLALVIAIIVALFFVIQFLLKIMSNKSGTRALAIAAMSVIEILGLIILKV